jgi:hypothetical protein
MILTYEFLPGSTITPVATGLVEPLAGSFQWIEESSDGSNLRVFNATELHFNSSSFDIFLNKTPLNDLGSNVFTNSNLTYFDEIVNIASLPANTWHITTGPMGGNYSGPSYAPTLLNYPELWIIPAGGGSQCAKLNISAQLIPEPCTLALLALGGFAVARRRR